MVNKKKEEIVILIVDDEESIRIANRLFLENFGFKRFQEAEGFQKASQIIKQEQGKIDLVVTDWDMEDQNAGLELIRYIRNYANYKVAGVPIIMVTGKPDKEIAEFAGANVVLEKPLKMEEFRQTIFTLLELE